MSISKTQAHVLTFSHNNSKLELQYIRHVALHYCTLSCFDVNKKETYTQENAKNTATVVRAIEKTGKYNG